MKKVLFVALLAIASVGVTMAQTSPTPKKAEKEQKKTEQKTEKKSVKHVKHHAKVIKQK